MNLYQPTVTGSLSISGSVNISGSLTIAGGGTISGTASLATTASYANNAELLDGLDSTVFTLTSSFTAFTASQAVLNGKYATTSSNTFTGQQYVTNTSFPIGFSGTSASLYTDGGLQVTRNSYFSSSLYVKGDLIVYGTQSVNYITSSQLNIADNIITVNTATPLVRFGGIAVQDSGSLGSGLTGSLLWDSQNNTWIYTNPSGSSYDGGMVLMGPPNYTTTGNEVGITVNALAKGAGSHHMTSSGIFESASLVGIGTSSPAAKLDVIGSSGSLVLPLSVTSFNATTNVGSSATSYGGLNVSNALDTTLAIRTLGSGHVQFATDASGRFISFATDLFTERMRIASGGNVGIGTTNPSSYSGYTTLSVNNATYGGLIDLQYNGTSQFRLSGEVTQNALFGASNLPMVFSTNGTERMRITAGGYIQISGTSNVAAITTDSSANVIGMYASSSVIDGAPRIEVTGTTYPSTPSIAYIRANTVIFTKNSASTETMRITSTGNVGIGTTSPNYALVVKSSTAGSNRIQILPATDFGFLQIDNSGGTVYIGTDNSAAGVFNAGNYSMNIYNSYSSNINFFNSGILRMQINSSGVITKPYQPVAMGAMPSDQFVPATSFTTISFQTNYGFNQANVGSSWNNGSNYFTAPATGTYLINLSLYTSNVGQVAMFINGSRTSSIPAGVPISGTTTWGGTIMIKMSAGDVLTLRGYGDGSGYVYLNTYHSWFAIWFLG